MPLLNDRLFLEDTGLAELGPRRIGAMDEAGIKVQILSAHTPGVQNVPGKKGIDFAYRLNKVLVDGPMATYPGRFQAFATLPLQNPEASADELERAEGLPFFYKRILEKMSEVTGKSLAKPFEQYFHDNFWFTTSAFPQTELLDLLLK
jgi:hypothetical protein